MALTDHKFIIGDTSDPSFVKIKDMASTVKGKGATLIGIEDASNKITAKTVEGALQEMVTGASGTFTSANGKTITVVNGKITSII